jgi:hypothetical protein
MDAAQMLNAPEIAREFEQLARRQQESAPEEQTKPQLRLVDPITQPIERIREPESRPEPAGSDLSEQEQSILAFERPWWKRAGSKEQAIRELFGISPSRYYQLLNALVDKPAAMRADPLLVKRLRKVRASRQRARNAQRLGIELD